jgi:hypothetical protein
MKVALLLPDGVGIRNFLLGPFRAEAQGRTSLAVLSAIPERARALYDDLDGPLEWASYQVYRDTPRLFMLRNTLLYAHTYSIDTFGMRCLRDRPRSGNSKRRIATELARWIGRGAAALGGARWLDRRLAAVVQNLPETAHYRSLLAEMRPAVLLSSNQRPYGVLPAVLAARSLGIPTATCIFSWDNLTSKGPIAAPFDHYLVWGDLMARELRQFYPEIPADRIHVVGAVQFDPHADASLLLPREQFFRIIGADPARPLICYSSGEPFNSPEDQDHVELLLNLIRQGRIAGNPQVVLRPTPTADARRFEGVRRRHPELIYSKPDWLVAGEMTWDTWVQALPLRSDVALLANLSHHADMNISVASTMTLDFLAHNRPVVNVAFDIADPPPFGQGLWESYYQFEHYQPVVKAGAALFSRSVDEFVEHINLYLANPRLHEENRRHLLDQELGVPVGGASPRIVETLLQIGRGQQVSSARVQAGVSERVAELVAMGDAERGRPRAEMLQSSRPSSLQAFPVSRGA